MMVIICSQFTKRLIFLINKGIIQKNPENGVLAMYKLCKTEQSAARQRELEQCLVELMNIRRYEEISVSDFCIHAGIPRKAFYRYFSSKDGALFALLDHTMLDYDMYRSSVDFNGDNVLQKDMESFFLFWKSQKPLLDALEHSGLSGVLMERAIHNVSDGLNQKYVRYDENPNMRDHVLRFALCGLMIMMVNWHHDGFRESVQEMTRIALRLVSEPLVPAVSEWF